MLSSLSAIPDFPSSPVVAKDCTSLTSLSFPFSRGELAGLGDVSGGERRAVSSTCSAFSTAIPSIVESPEALDCTSDSTSLVDAGGTLDSSSLGDNGWRSDSSSSDALALEPNSFCE